MNKAYEVVKRKGGMIEMAWKESESVKTWIEGLEKRTRENYLGRFPRFLEFIKMGPDELIQERMRDLTSQDPRVRFRFEQKVLAYQDLLKKDYKNYSLHDFIKTAMSFFSRNRLPLNFRAGEIESAKISRHMWIPSNLQIRQMYQVCSPRDKVTLLLSYQVALNPVDVSSLDIQDMPIYDELGKIQTEEPKYFELERSKTGMVVQTVLTSELLHDLDIFLRSRGYPKDGALLLSHKGNRLTTEDINTCLKAVATISLGEDLGKKFTATLLRKSFQQCLDQTPTISKNLSEILMGHSIGISAYYSKPTPDEIKTVYDMVFPKVSVNGYVQQRGDIREMRQSMTSMNDALDLVMGTLRKMVEKEIGVQHQYQVPSTGMGLIEKPTDKEVLKKYLES